MADYRFFQNLQTENEESVLTTSEQLLLRTSNFMFTYFGANQVITPNHSIVSIAFNQQYLGVLGYIRTFRPTRYWAPSGMMPF
mmetsp:Transcript_554/g.618  ORF Transcript_554/g.618 Transcript_554/m.618 type:complete len:83 (+) Transcript_554:440-688(+)